VAIEAAITKFFGTIMAFVDSYLPQDVTRYFPDPVSQYLDMMTNPEQVSQPLVAFAGWTVPKLLPHMTNAVSGFASSIPILFAQFGVAILLTYYLLIDGKRAIDKALLLLPEKELISHFLEELNAIYNNLFNVYFITCALIGVIAATGFILLGIPYPFLWGVVIFVASLIPLIGAGTIYVPMALYYLVIQDYLRFVALLAFGTIFLNVIPENIIRPRLAQRGASIHPAITLLAFAAPLFVVGMVGVIIGPALYGFVLAVYRTRIQLLKMESEEVRESLERLSEDEETREEDAEYTSVISRLFSRLAERTRTTLRRLNKGR
jgi:predicted PurR-regulated permease PerM